jgi:hypothetical protein
MFVAKLAPAARGGCGILAVRRNTWRRATSVMVVRGCKAWDAVHCLGLARRRGIVEAWLRPTPWALPPSRSALCPAGKGLPWSKGPMQSLRSLTIRDRLPAGEPAFDVVAGAWLGAGLLLGAGLWPRPGVDQIATR